MLMLTTTETWYAYWTNVVTTIYVSLRRRCNSRQRPSLSWAETDSHGPGTRASKVSAITKMPRPEDKAGVQRFLGMCQYLSKFRPNLSTSVLPLRELTKEDAAVIWSNMHESAFHAAKELISKATALRYYDPSLPVTLQVDAIDGVPLQQDQPVCSTPHTLSNTEKQYAQIEKECLAIIPCINKWHQYLYGTYRSSATRVNLQKAHQQGTT